MKQLTPPPHTRCKKENKSLLLRTPFLDQTDDTQHALSHTHVLTHTHSHTHTLQSSSTNQQLGSHSAAVTTEKAAAVTNRAAEEKRPAHSIWSLSNITMFGFILVLTVHVSLMLIFNECKAPRLPRPLVVDYVNLEQQ